MLAGLKAAHARWATGCYSLWYPIKSPAAVGKLHAALQQSQIRRILVAELYTRFEHAEDTLLGSGMILVNPPYQCDQALRGVLPVLGIVSCFYLMLSLPVITWVRFLVWLDLGLIIYWVYGRTHSTLANAAEQAKRTGMQALANFITAFGALALFNGFAMAILGFFTEWGITNETTAKWHEIGVTHEQADIFGLKVLGVSLVVFIIGRVLSKSSGEK